MAVKIGLALGGGGARGSYQIGVLEAFRKVGILDQIEHVSGTSIGAINTMMVMARFSYERMMETWAKIENKDIYGDKFKRLKWDKHGLFSLQEVFDKLKEDIKLSEIRSSHIHGYATASKLKKGSLIDQVLIHRMEKEVFYLNEFKDPLKAVLASASIPILFGTTEIDDTYYVDGGAVDNCPIKPLIDAGCNVILTIPIDGMPHKKKFKHQDILVVNLETHYLFNPLQIDILDFKTSEIERKALYGEWLGYYMIHKLIGLGYLDEHHHFKTPHKYKEIKISKSEELDIKEGVFELWT